MYRLLEEREEQNGVGSVENEEMCISRDERKILSYY